MTAESCDTVHYSPIIRTDSTCFIHTNLYKNSCIQKGGRYHNNISRDIIDIKFSAIGYGINLTLYLYLYNQYFYPRINPFSLEIVLHYDK